jgi:hypothetical protein
MHRLFIDESNYINEEIKYSPGAGDLCCYSVRTRFFLDLFLGILK